MKKIITTLILISLPFFVVDCDDGSSKNKSNVSSKKLPYTSSNRSILETYSYVTLNVDPNEDWVGKYLKIEFDNTGSKFLAGKTKIVQLLNYNKDDEGYKYFSVKDLSDGIIREIFFFWFGNTGGKNGFGPNIKSWKEAINKNIDNKTVTPIQRSEPKQQIIKIKPKGRIDDKGNKYGEWVYYYPSGEIKKTGSYKNGEKEKKWMGYHKNGNIKYVEEYQNNLENGKWLSFDENGKLIAKGFQKNGMKDGKWITHFHDNGKVHIEKFFKQGKPIGSINVYLPDGKLLESTFLTDYDYYESFDPHAELDRMVKLVESMGIYDHNVEAYHRAIDAGDRDDVDAFIKALYDIDPTLDLDY